MDTVLVVGGAIGGRAVVELYAGNGCNVIIADQNQPAGEALVSELRDVSKGIIQFEPVDATIPSSVETLCENIRRRFGYLNHIISVVGGSGYSDWLGLSEGKLDDISSTTALNLLSHQYVLRFGKSLLAACPQSNRSVILVGSINALRSFDLPAYSAAKAGMIGLMYGAANEFTLKHGIRINLVSPGTTLSERTKKLPKNVEVLMQHALLPEMPDAREIAEAIFTLSHRLLHCTQHNLVIDSGQTAYGPPHNLLNS